MAVTETMSYLSNVLFPPACAVCRGPVSASQTLCSDCWRELAFLDGEGCDRCGAPMPGEHEPGSACDSCLRHPPRWRRGRAAFRYDGTGRKLVLALKHGDRLDTVPMLAAWMARAGGRLAAGADLIAPVPLHWTRRLKRRGNQSAAVARALARRAAKRQAYAPRLLVRTLPTASQDGRGRAARIANIDGALALGPEGAVAGKSVLLIDDVLTTGATLNAAAEVLYDAGASAVDVLVLALVVRDDGAYISAEAEDPDHAPSRHLHDPDLPVLHDGQAPAGPEGRRLHGNQRDGG